MPLNMFDGNSVDDALTVSGSRSSIKDLLEEGGSIKLPTYLTEGQLGASSFEPTAVLDCVGFVETTLQRTRLTIFEITRRQSSIFSRAGLSLEGPALELDKLLAATENALQEEVRFDGVMGGYWLTQALVAHPDFQKANAAAKTKVLRFDRDLRVGVAEPLKRALIDKKKPDYNELKKIAQDYPSTVVKICSMWDKKVLPVAESIAAQGPPDKVIVEMLEMVNDETKDLIRQATQNNLDVLHHQKFVALGGRKDDSWPHETSPKEREAIRAFLREYCDSLNLPALKPKPKKDHEDDDN